MDILKWSEGMPVKHLTSTQGEGSVWVWIELYTPARGGDELLLEGDFLI